MRNHTETIEFKGAKFDAGNWELTNEGITNNGNLRIAADNETILRIGTSVANRIYFDDGGIDLQTDKIIRNKGTVQFYNNRTNTTISLEYSIRDSRYCLFVQEGE